MIISNQNDQIIEEVKERLEKKRRRVFKYNLILSLCFCIIVIGFLGTIHYYNNLLNKISSKNDSLVKLADELQISIDSFNYATKSVAEEIKIRDTIIKLSEKSGTKGLKKIENSLSNARDSARNFARLGYNLLKEYDFAGAKEAFGKSEKAFNGYRDSYEVYNLLRSYENKFNDLAIQKQIMEKIIKDYNSLIILKKEDIK